MEGRKYRVIMKGYAKQKRAVKKTLISRKKQQFHTLCPSYIIHLSHNKYQYRYLIIIIFNDNYLHTVIVNNYVFTHPYVFHWVIYTPQISIAGNIYVIHLLFYKNLPASVLLKIASNFLKILILCSSLQSSVSHLYPNQKFTMHLK